MLPSSEVNSGGRETPVCQISKLLQMLQNVARCCKVKYLSKLKSENRGTTTIELAVVGCPRKGKKPFFSKSYAMLQTPQFLQLLQKPVTVSNDVELMSGEPCQVSCRRRLGFRSYSGKPPGGVISPPRRSRVNTKLLQPMPENKTCIIGLKKKQNTIPLQLGMQFR